MIEFMEQYIDKSALVAEIERRLWLLVPKMTFHQQRVEFYPNTHDLTVGIDVTHTVDDFYNLINEASLCNHGVSIEEMQNNIDFDCLYKEYNGGARCRHKFDRKLQDGLCNGNKYAYDIPLSFFGSTSSSSSSSSSGILDMGRKNLGNSGIGFGDYYGEY